MPNENTQCEWSTRFRVVITRLLKKDGGELWLQADISAPGPGAWSASILGRINEEQADIELLTWVGGDAVERLLRERAEAEFHYVAHNWLDADGPPWVFSGEG